MPTPGLAGCGIKYGHRGSYGRLQQKRPRPMPIVARGSKCLGAAQIWMRKVVRQDRQRNCDAVEKHGGPSSQRWGGLDTQPYQALGKQPCEPSSLELQSAPRCACRGHAPPAFSPFCRIRESNTAHGRVAARLAAEGGGQLVNSCSWLPFACKRMESSVSGSA